MPTKTAVANYTPEMVETMTSLYQSALGDTERKEMVETIAKGIDRTVNSVRSKLVKLGIYIKPKPTTKSGAVPVRKAELVTNIADLLGADEDLLCSLEKSTIFCFESCHCRP